MSTEQSPEVQEFLKSELPLSQVNTSNNPANGWYDFTVGKLDVLKDEANGGKLYIQAEFAVEAQHGSATVRLNHRERMYVGSDTDPQALLPETRINSVAIKTLTKIARVCGVSTNNQQTEAFLASLISQRFTNRIETKPSKKNKDRSYCNMGGNPVKLGTIPAKVDAIGSLSNGQAGPVVTATSTLPEGATFGAE